MDVNKDKLTVSHSQSLSVYWEWQVIANAMHKWKRQGSTEHTHTDGIHSTIHISLWSTYYHPSRQQWQKRNSCFKHATPSATKGMPGSPNASIYCTYYELRSRRVRGWWLASHFHGLTDYVYDWIALLGMTEGIDTIPHTCRQSALHAFTTNYICGEDTNIAHLHVMIHEH